MSKLRICMLCLAGLLVVVAPLAIVGLSTSALWADNREVVPTKIWVGSLNDESLRAEAVDVIVDRNGLEKLWTVWGVAEPLPKIDFEKEIVLVATGNGSMLSFEYLVLDANGNLEMGRMESLDLVPGFRYLIATVNRDGIKSVNGKVVPPEVR